MTNVPLSKMDWKRGVAKEADLILKNRYFEANPVLSDEQTALIARPGMKRYLYVGNGPIRATYSQPGSFKDALFVVSSNEVWRVDTDNTKTLIYAGLTSSDRAAVSMAATANIDDVPEYLFLADGKILYCYMANGYARGTLSGAPANNDVVRIDLTYYKFTTGSVDAGTPNGSAGNPWLVQLGVSPLFSFTNLKDAMNVSGIAGTQYSTATTKHISAQGFAVGATSLTVRATLIGPLGNSVITTETGGAIAWGAGTLTSGGTDQFFQVPTPDDVSMISLGYIASYVVCVPSQGQKINGRFYWIEPGEITIDPLNFATAERAPDPIYGVVVFGDQFWLPGQTTTEVWYFTGNQDSPVARLQGVTFDRGTWEGTALQVKDSMMIIDNDGAVFQIGGGLKRVSNPAVEELIREAIQYQASQILY